MHICGLLQWDFNFYFKITEVRVPYRGATTSVFYNRKLTLMKKLFFSIAILSKNAFEIVQRNAKARKIFADGRILVSGRKKRTFLIQVYDL